MLQWIKQLFATSSPADKTSPAHRAVHNIKVLGSGCAKCHALLDNTKKAVAQSPCPDDFDIAYITDMKAIAAYGVMSTPALVLDGTVIASGAILSPSQIAALLPSSNAH